jgi:hypothetical protein
MSEFMSHDMAPILASFISLGHVPKELIDECNKQHSLVAFGQRTSHLLLGSMIDAGITGPQDFYQKLWARVEQLIPKLHWVSCR